MLVCQGCSPQQWIRQSSVITTNRAPSGSRVAVTISEKLPPPSRRFDPGAWPSSLATSASVALIPCLRDLVQHQEAGEKPHAERRKGFRWKLMIMRKELGPQPSREGGQPLFETTRKADAVLQFRKVGTPGGLGCEGSPAPPPEPTPAWFCSTPLNKG